MYGMWNWKSLDFTIVPNRNLFGWIIFGMTSAFLWNDTINLIIYKKGNIHRFWTCSIKTLDPSLGRYLIVDFKNRQFVDLRTYNFVDVTFLKYKISTMWPRWKRHGTLGSYENKNFSIKIVVAFPPKQKTSFKANISFIQRNPLF